MDRDVLEQSIKQEEKDLKKKDPKENEKDDDGDYMSSETIDQMFFTNMGEGTLEEIDPDLGEEQEEGIKTKTKEDTFEFKGEYEEELVRDVLSNPQKYMVTTSRGDKNLKEAMDEGWDPKSDTFDDSKNFNKNKEEVMNGLSESNRQGIEGMLDPSNAKFPPSEADTYGLPPDHPMVQAAPNAGMEMPPEEESMEGIDPAMLEGGMM
jgi:hypothetical protein